MANPEKDTQDNEANPRPSAPPKQSPNDPSLSLVKKPFANKKTIQIAASLVGAAVLIGLGFGLQPSKPKAQQQKKVAEQQYTKQVPSDLAITPDDYMPVHPTDTQNNSPNPALASYTRGPGVLADKNTALPQYGTYTRTPTADQQAQFPTPNQQSEGQTQAQANQQSTSKGPIFSLGSAFAPNNTPDEEAKRRVAALTSGFFFPWNSADQQAQALKAKSTAQQEADQQANAQANAIASAYESAYSKQNLAQEKRNFLASQQADYSAYLDNRYLSPVDAAHLLQASTLIPLTLQTSINSDLPGDVIALVDENVFNSLSGENILIPRGSRLIGTYDNTISFGQDRVLVAWNRLIRADGVSISLRGMKGTDLEGNSGMHDQVDFHLANILAVVGASTAFNVGTNAAIAALSTNQFLSSLATAMTAQGSTSSNVTSAATAAATEYASKIVNQAPTILVRAGSRGYCVIDKDMILPAFVDSDGGYMPLR